MNKKMYNKIIKNKYILLALFLLLSLWGASTVYIFWGWLFDPAFCSQRFIQWSLSTMVTLNCISLILSKQKKRKRVKKITLLDKIILSIFATAGVVVLALAMYALIIFLRNII